MPHIHRWDIPNPTLLVHILHGMAEHGARYRRLARALKAEGIAVWAHDHRGHGRTPPAPRNFGHFGDVNGWRLLIDDAWDVSSQMKKMYRRVPIVLFAHSMGSFIGQTLLAERGNGYRAVVLCGTNGPPDFAERFLKELSVAQLKASHPRDPGVLLDGIMGQMFNRDFQPAATSFDWLSSEPREVAKYISDRRCGFPLSAQAWFDFLHGKADLGSDLHVRMIPKTLPIRVIAGKLDPVGDRTKGVQRLLRLYGKHKLNVSHQFYANARHELLNEVQPIRDRVTADLIAWLGQFHKRRGNRTRSGPSSSGRNRRSIPPPP